MLMGICIHYQAKRVQPLKGTSHSGLVNAFFYFQGVNNF